MGKAVRIFGKAVLCKKSLARLSPARWEQVEANNTRSEYLSVEPTEVNTRREDLDVGG